MATLVALSGATSFSALGILRATQRKGLQTVGLCPGHLDEYRGIKQQRLEALASAQIRCLGALRAEDGSLAEWIRAFRPGVWVHHHHPMRNFRSPEYSMDDVERQAIAPLLELVAALKQARTRAVVFTGSYFEPGEGANPLPPTNYGVSKAWVSNELRRLCQDAKITFSKVVIPSPTGLLEDQDRITPVILRKALERATFELRGPDSRMDMIPGEALGEVYAQTVVEALDGVAGVRRPSYWQTTVSGWVDVVRENLLGPLGLSLEAKIMRAESPPGHLNPVEEKVSWDPQPYWDSYRSSLVKPA